MNEKKPTINYSRALVDIFSPMVLIMVVQNVVSVFATQWLVLYVTFNFAGSSYSEFIDAVMESAMGVRFNGYVSLGYAVICIGLFGYLYKKNQFISGGFKSQLRKFTSNQLFFWLGAVIFVVGIQYVCIYFINALSVVFPEWLIEYNQILNQAGLMDEYIDAPILLYAVLLAPLCEELAFRGLTFKYARRIMPFWFANAAQAALFAALHMNKLQAAYTFVFGMLMGYIMYKYDNIFVVTLIHIMFNVVGAVLSGYLTTGGNSPIEFYLWFLGSMIVTYLGVMLLEKAAPVAQTDTTEEDI